MNSDLYACDCSCDLDGVERPHLWSEKMRVARVPHTCCECRREIRPGERYEHARGLYGDRWDSYATCLGCHHLRRAYCPNGWVYGELHVAVEDCIGIDPFEVPDDDDDEEEVTP